MADLIARLHSAVRHAEPAVMPETLRYADVTLDSGAFRVTRGHHILHLAPTEFRLLRFLLLHPGRVFSRENLLEAIWGHNTELDLRTVDVHILRLRRSINVSGTPDIIRTVRSAGYALDIAPRATSAQSMGGTNRRAVHTRRVAG